MKEPVFRRSEFELCVLSNPSGYPISFTHAGIAYSKDGYNNYHYFLSQSPYPSGNDDYENPCFYYANARDGNLPPIEWNAFSGNPLQEDPGNGYNADPDILFFNGDLYLGNRPYIRKPSRQWVNMQKCTIVNNSFSFGEPVTLYSTETIPANFGYPQNYLTTFVSPALIPYGNKVRAYHLVTNSYNDASRCRNLVIMEGEDLITENNFAFLKYGSILGNVEPWHIDVFSHGGKLYAILACIADSIAGNCYNYLAVSDDWENFRIYDRPLTDIKSYRSSAFVRDDGMFILYLATLNYKPAGNVTQDGRNILCAYRSFEDVLNEVDS